MNKLNAIYIIDDDPITVFGIRKILSNIVVDTTVDTFVNGQLAIENIKNSLENAGQIPEVIFLDLNMPVMDGWQFLAEFIDLPIKEKVRINIVTSSIDTADKERWEFYRPKSRHLITFNNKPVKKDEIVQITKLA